MLTAWCSVVNVWYLFQHMRCWKETVEETSLHQPFLCSSVSLNLIEMSNEKCFFSLERKVERKEEQRIFLAVSEAGFLPTLAPSTETHSFLISIPEVNRWKITSLCGKTCSETLLLKGLKGCGCMCKSQQVPVALLYLVGNPLESSVVRQCST